MRAVDTNVVLRYLLRDDLRQAELADQALANPCFLPITVVLEMVWVMESHFKLERADASRMLTELLDLDTVHCNEIGAVRWALERFRDGADIADMLHLVESREAAQFVTFDRRLAKSAGAKAPIPVETLR